MLSAVLQNHYRNYLDQSVENIKRDAKGLLHVVSDYEGRVVFELLQNAFDKADQHIGIYIKGDVLYVANDGTNFSYNTQYDYAGGNNEHRGDFLSICSMFTSTKSVATAIGNKGIGFKSVFSIAKNQHKDYKFPSRYVDIYTHGLFFQDNLIEGKIQQCSFRIYEMIRNVEDLIDLESFNKQKLQTKINAARQEYPDVGIPGYYFPFEINPVADSFVNELLKKYVTVIAIPLEKAQEIKNLITENIISAGTQFNFIQLKYSKEFHIEVEIEEASIYNKQIRLNDNRLIATVIKNNKIKELAALANIDLENISVAMYLRDDDKGKLYNYLPSGEASPFSNIDFHADFRTTLNRTQINWEGAVGDYNKALLRACLELYFTYFSENSIKLNNQYINEFSFKSDSKWHYKFLKPSFNINSESAKLIWWIFKVEDWNYQNLINWICYNTKNFFENDDHQKEEYENFYQTILHFSKCITNDYNQKKYSKVERFFNQLKGAFNRYEVIYLPRILSKENQDVFFEKERSELSNLINLRFTTVEIDNSYEGKILKSELKIKDASDINEYLRYYRQMSLDGKCHTEAITEEQQIELLRNVYEFYLRKQDKDIIFCERYSSVLDSDSREKYSLRNHARFSITTLFLKTTDQKYKPAQLCSIEELDVDFKNKLNFPDDFYSFLGVSSNSYIKVFDQRVHEQCQDGLNYIPRLVEKDNDRIDKTIPFNCRIEYRGNSVHPALINDNYTDIFGTIKNLKHKELKPIIDVLKVKDYNSFSSEYFTVLLKHLEKYINNPSFYDSIRMFYAYTFRLFHQYKKWLIFNGESIEFSSSHNFWILKSKTDLDKAIERGEKNILLYEADKGVSDEELQTKILNFEEIYRYNENNITDISSQFKDDLMLKLPFILYEITNDKQSERDFLEYDYNILETICDTNFYKVENIEVIKKSKIFEYNYNAKYYINNAKVLVVDVSNKNISIVLSYLLFKTNRYADKIEIILFHRELIDLENEYDMSEISVFKSKYDQTYQKKRNSFLNKIIEHFPEIDIEEVNWNYNTSASIRSLIEKSRLNDFKIFLSELKFANDYKDYDFGLDIVYFPNSTDALGLIEKNMENNIDELSFLVDKISSNINIKKVLINSSSNSIIESSVRKLKKKIIKNVIFSNPTTEELESVGSNGEHEVLNYYITKYYSLPINDRKKIILSVFDLIKNIVDDVKYYEDLKEQLIENLDTNESLKTLIPYLYITHKYKYSYFDLVGFNGVNACLVEVKTTSGNRNDFYISQAEIDCALKYPNYEIVRVSETEMKFLGNPIVQFKNQLNGFQNDQYKLITTKYKIELLS